MLLFRDIKQNYPVHILDTQEFSYVMGKATGVSFPRMEVNQKTGKTEMVIDVTVEAGGKTATYTIPENLSVTYAGNLVLSTDKSGLTADAESVKNKAEQILASAPHAKKIIEKAPSIFAEINPVYRERQETEQRFSKIEGSVEEMRSSVSEVKDMLSQFIKEFKS